MQEQQRAVKKSSSREEDECFSSKHQRRKNTMRNTETGNDEFLLSFLTIRDSPIYSLSELLPDLTNILNLN
jgi:hypothetical protein